ncbi:MAG: proteasome protein [Methanocalculus sp. MSAO_Arc1]|uniref:Mov34/MPN/PAD-1 family protein n=1 Tax=Methanocalculus TaxID=71151 RepID=UPI000FF5F2DC|nr:MULTISPECIES: Mov34/MPN/PAD-1 family protein [unclassified Methanocalculus]MCP1662188.1 proteasome lid subunit RPN8/RPN11 [Methanocalculus sp. AMF5]RQD79085.1 MAG: proteasome protein [Methanocalculus sp. MSAO_Arc1]
MKIRAISRDTLHTLLEMAKSQHPLEFVALLESEDGVLSGINLLPGTRLDERSASVLTDMIPLGMSFSGSAHSHPNGVIRPSEADIGFFPRFGNCHLIIGYPYGADDWQAYSANGTERSLEVIS